MMRTQILSRRGFLRTGAGIAGAALAAGGCRSTSGGAGSAPLAGTRSATPADLQDLVGDGRKRPILLRGGVVLSLDPKVGDFERADVLIEGKTIARIAPAIAVGDAEIVDCAGTIVMPGFITTHNHQYEAIQRSLIPDGLLAGAWPLETYG
jgi:5-methylthioadenosine/S-adenosylhomocysteine deaminase